MFNFINFPVTQYHTRLIYIAPERYLRPGVQIVKLAELEIPELNRNYCWPVIGQVADLFNTYDPATGGNYIYYKGYNILQPEGVYNFPWPPPSTRGGDPDRLQPQMYLTLKNYDKEIVIQDYPLRPLGLFTLNTSVPGFIDPIDKKLILQIIRRVNQNRWNMLYNINAGLSELKIVWPNSIAPDYFNYENGFYLPITFQRYEPNKTIGYIK